MWRIGTGSQPANCSVNGVSYIWDNFAVSLSSDFAQCCWESKWQQIDTKRQIVAHKSLGTHGSYSHCYCTVYGSDLSLTKKQLQQQNHHPPPPSPPLEFRLARLYQVYQALLKCGVMVSPSQSSQALGRTLGISLPPSPLPIQDSPQTQWEGAFLVGVDEGLFILINLFIQSFIQSFIHWQTSFPIPLTLFLTVSRFFLSWQCICSPSAIWV